MLGAGSYDDLPDCLSRISWFSPAHHRQAKAFRHPAVHTLSTYLPQVQIIFCAPSADRRIFLCIRRMMTSLYSSSWYSSLPPLSSS